MVDRPGQGPSSRSAFAAAFLSFVFPGLGHAYAGIWRRALAFAALPLLALAFGAGMLLNGDTRRLLLVSLLDARVLLAVVIVDALLLLYRLAAIIDAYRVTVVVEALRAAGTARYGLPRLRLHGLSVAGLAAVLLVAVGGHAAVAYYDLTAYDLLTTITSGGDNAGAPPGPGATAAPAGSPASTPTPGGSQRLNILLIGSDQRPHEGTFNADTLITVSIDPQARRVAMFSLPRDTVDVPLPGSWPAAAYYGGVYPAKINSLWTRARGAPDLFRFDDEVRGYAALKGAIGELLGLDIRWYVELDFGGFRKVVDTLGGVIVPVPYPVLDNQYPLEDGRGSTRLYIPATAQHMDGELALAYARSRHGSSDFDRAARQQSVLLSLRQQADIPTLLARLPDLVAALKTTIHTDIPTSELPRLAGLASEIDAGAIRSVVLSPPVYQTETPTGDPRGYVVVPKVAVIQDAVRKAFTEDLALETSREVVAQEGARVWVLNGSGIEGQATRTRDYLAYRGFAATVPSAGGGRADRQDYAGTVVTVYNGAAARLPQSLVALRGIFSVSIVERTDPAVTVDVIVITGARTPQLTPPP